MQNYRVFCILEVFPFKYKIEIKEGNPPKMHTFWQTRVVSIQLAVLSHPDQYFHRNKFLLWFYPGTSPACEKSMTDPKYCAQLFIPLKYDILVHPLFKLSDLRQAFKLDSPFAFTLSNVFPLPDHSWSWFKSQDGLKILPIVKFGCI